MFSSLVGSIPLFGCATGCRDGKLRSRGDVRDAICRRSSENSWLQKIISDPLVQDIRQIKVQAFCAQCALDRSQFCRACGTDRNERVAVRPRLCRASRCRAVVACGRECLTEEYADCDAQLSPTEIAFLQNHRGSAVDRSPFSAA